MSAASNNKFNVTRRDVAYYLDAQQRDASDHGGWSRKNGQFFALRERLLGLTDEEFDVAIRAIEGIVNSIRGNGEPSAVGKNPMSGDEIREFADLAKKSSPTASASSVKQVSRV